MRRRTLLHKLFSSMVAVPLLGANEKISFGREGFPTSNTLVEPEDEQYIRRAFPWLEMCLSIPSERSWWTSKKA